VRIKWRNILLLLVVVGTIVVGAILLLKGDVVLAQVQEGTISGISRLASRLPGSGTGRAVPDVSSTPLAVGEPIIYDNVSWFSMPTPTPTRPAIRIAQPKEVATVRVDALNLRAGPGTDYEVVGTAHREDELEILGRNTDGTWIQVYASDDTEAWVYLDLVTMVEDVLDRVPVVE
jgi:hypothetical protein